MGLTKLILKFAAPLPKLEAYDKYLFIGPHPDDIEIGAGATAAKLAAAGKQVCFLICTDGRFGDGNAPDGISGQALVEMRKQEAIASAAALGITDVRFLGLSDGGFYELHDLEQGIAGVIGDFKPDVIFAPDPCVTSECHKDHLNVGNAAKQFACFAPYPGIMEGYRAAAANIQAIAFYMTAKPTRFVGTHGFVKKQLTAIFEHHLSQFPKGSADGNAIRLYLTLRSIDFGLRSLKGRAEGFRVLGVTHMHCLPEAGR
ncbi:MAG: PIG-L family deacetylase [Lachnospiraceae bacterium]|nr:PIG-L family deacetylase [Lachnospiraceae bacterium]